MKNVMKNMMPATIYLIIYPFTLVGAVIVYHLWSVTSVYCKWRMVDKYRIDIGYVMSNNVYDRI